MNILQEKLYSTILTANVNIDTVIKVPQAFLNAVFYMGVAFIILILLALLILLIKVIFTASAGNKDTVNVPVNAGNMVNGRYGSPGEIDLARNTELVAVITAAVMAYMGDEAPEDGLVVRNIRRSSAKR